MDASKITAEGYGESRPLATNDTREGRQQNRRVEIIVGAGSVADAAQRDSGAGAPP